MFVELENSWCHRPKAAIVKPHGKIDSEEASEVTMAEGAMKEGPVNQMQSEAWKAVSSALVSRQQEICLLDVGSSGQHKWPGDGAKSFAMDAVLGIQIAQMDS